MKGDSIDARLSMLVLWLGARLSAREAVSWVTGAFKEKKGLSGEQLVALLRELHQQTIKRPDLSPDIRTIWKLFLNAALSRETIRSSWHRVEEFRGAIRQGSFGPDDIKNLIDFARPYLSPAEHSIFISEDEQSTDDISRWVTWEFKSVSGALDHGIERIGRELLARLPSDLLVRLSKESTSALVATLELAREAGWLNDGDDRVNRSVARVAFNQVQAASATPDDDEADQESRDPDALDDNFAPLVRLITRCFEALVAKDPPAARQAFAPWAAQNAALFVRLQAHGGSHPEIWSGIEVAQFLQDLPDLYFWRWGAFPEVACLRALRWRDLPVEMREQIAERLVAGPKRDDFDPDQDISQDTLLYWRDHEIGRIFDNNEDCPQQFSQIVKARRAGDAEFPVRIPALDSGERSFGFRRVPDGDPSAFGNMTDEILIEALAKGTRNRPFGEGDNAEAFARKNRRKVVDLLALQNNTVEELATVWELALSYPHERLEDPESARQTEERIATLALVMDDGLFARISDRLCYWLDATDEPLKEAPTKVQLWVRLLPRAAQRENTGDGSDVALAADVTSAALNVPLGHLIFFFFRRCPKMPKKGKALPLPEPFAGLLKNLQGRAKAIMANRMAATINYFWLAGPDWMRTFVLNPMMSNKPEGIALWEAFAKYGPVPLPSLWSAVEQRLFRHIAQGQLSKEALRRLVEMAVVVWIWAREGDNKYALDVSALRSTLGISSNEVRGAAAWQFSRLFDRDSDEATKAEGKTKSKNRWPTLGQKFFSEVWPMEPAAQSPQSANDFAGIPALAGRKYYSGAIQRIIPFLRPFDVWDVESSFGLTATNEHLVDAHPTETLMLIAACVPEDQKHFIERLGPLLSLIGAAKPELERDPEFRRLRRLVAADDV